MKNIKKNLIAPLKILIISGIIILGTQMAVAAWTPPPSSPPNGNVEAPINVGSNAQAKNGSVLSGSTFNVGGTLSSDVLSVFGTAYLGGNVGINIPNPTAKLQVQGNGGASMDLKVNGRIQTGTGSTNGGMWVNDPATLFFGAYTTDIAGIYNNSAWRLKVFSDGKVGAAQYCDLNGNNCSTPPFSGGSPTNICNGTCTANYVPKFSASDGTIKNSLIYDTGSFVCIGYGSSCSYKLDVNGAIRATSFFYFSDKRLKDNISPLQNSLDKILQLKGVSFNWKDSGRASVGLIAQDVEKVYPELVETDPKTGLKAVQYGNLVAPLLEAIKEQQKEIDSLKSEINDLKKAK